MDSKTWTWETSAEYARARGESLQPCTDRLRHYRKDKCDPLKCKAPDLPSCKERVAVERAKANLPDRIVTDEGREIPRNPDGDSDCLNCVHAPRHQGQVRCTMGVFGKKETYSIKYNGGREMLRNRFAFCGFFERGRPRTGGRPKKGSPGRATEAA